MAVGAAHASPAEPRDLLLQVRSTALDPQGAVTLGNIELALGPATIDIARGVLIPARTREGRVVELVFVGQARFRISPPDRIEAGQLELFTGRPELDSAVEEAVFVLADDSMRTALLEQQPTTELRPDLLARAEEIHHKWLLRPERRSTGVEAAIFKYLAGDQAFQRYFAVWVKSYETGDFVYQLDPEDEEQLTLANFSPLDVRGWERMRLARHIKIQQRKGRWLGVRVDDLGAWDIWLSTAWSQDGVRLPANTGFESEHYDLDVVIDHDRKLDATAKLRLRAVTSGRRAINMELFRDLAVTAVRDGQGRDLFWFRSGNDVVLHLAEPSRAGEVLDLEIDYEGRALKWVGAGTFDLEETAGWYPHVGTVDRATYDVKLSWPKKYDMIASGTLVDSGQEDRYRWERRRFDMKTTAFSFVLGEFLIEKRKFDHVEVTMAFSRAAPSRLTEAIREEALATVGRALRYFEETYGAYPLDELTVVTLNRRFSQSYLGFVTLTDSILVGDGPFDGSDVSVVRETLIAHEIAHQWWGNMVGWSSYRDQWLSEAMANYSALQFYAAQQGAGSTFLADMSAGWRDMLNQKTSDGRTIESLGPLVLGGRLNSSRSSGAYRAIVYRKGAVVLAMLARAIGEERFLGMLRSLVDVASDKVLTTESFLSAIERMSGLDLRGFSEQFIYGTGIPEVYYDYRTQTADDGGWRVSGEARLLADPSYDFAVVRSVESWDVTRTPRFDARSDSTALMVPFRIRLATDAPRSQIGNVVSSDSGRLLIEGRDEDFEVVTSSRPVDLELDPLGEILAHFYPVNVYPKRGLRYRAHDQALQGNLAEAERSYRSALDQPAARILGDREAAWTRDAAGEGQIEDARIHLALARLYLDQRRHTEAEAELSRADELIGPDRQLFRMERDALGGRLEIQRGDFAAAYRRLKKTMRLAGPRRGPRTWSSLLWQVQLNSERRAVIEGFALLAIAAHETGAADDFAWAAEEARYRGVDLSPLDAARGPAAAR